MRRWWRSLSFFWQTFFSILVFIAGVVASVEVLFEPGTEYVLLRWSNGPRGWHEVAMLGLGIVFPSLLCSWVVARLVVRRLAEVARTVRRFARGDLSLRLPEAKEDRDAFTGLARDFNRMADSLERQLANETRLLADISHELRSPLTRMNLTVALLGRKQSEAERQDALEALDDEIAYMSHLVGRLLEQGRDRMLARQRAERIDFSALAGELAEGFSLRATTERKTVETDVAPGLFVTGAPATLRSILENPLANALFYTAEGGRIRLTVAREGDHLSLSVRDWGPGVPEEHLDDIFRAFFRVDDSRARASGGSGLGLALVMEAALSLGGEVRAHNRQPGLEIVVRLPLADDGDPAADGAAATTGNENGLKP